MNAARSAATSCNIMRRLPVELLNISTFDQVLSCFLLQWICGIKQYGDSLLSSFSQNATGSALFGYFRAGAEWVSNTRRLESAEAWRHQNSRGCLHTKRCRWLQSRSPFPPQTIAWLTVFYYYTMHYKRYTVGVVNATAYFGKSKGHPGGQCSRTMYIFNGISVTFLEINLLHFLMLCKMYFDIWQSDQIN